MIPAECPIASGEVITGLPFGPLIAEEEFQKARISGVGLLYRNGVASNAPFKALRLEVVKRSDLHRFVVLLKRWIVERTFTWISNCRRLAKDFERHARKTVVLGCRAPRGHSSTKPSRAAMATASARLPAASFSRIPAT
jgi:hypothetical protein